MALVRDQMDSCKVEYELADGSPEATVSAFVSVVASRKVDFQTKISSIVSEKKAL
jgi:hypothetical protein